MGGTALPDVADRVTGVGGVIGARDTGGVTCAIEVVGAGGVDQPDRVAVAAVVGLAAFVDLTSVVGLTPVVGLTAVVGLTSGIGETAGDGAAGWARGATSESVLSSYPAQGLEGNGRSSVLGKAWSQGLGRAGGVWQIGQAASSSE